MAKQIKRTDIVEDDIFKVTRDSAKETLEVLDKLNAGFKESAKILSEEIKKATTESAKGIDTFIKSTEKANKLKYDSIKADEQTIKIKQQLVKLEELEEKRRLSKEKADALAITNAQKLQREEERKAKAIEKAAKAAKDEGNAYKQLEKNTRDLKNQSKQLAAEMLVLEKNGKRNSTQYRDLAAKYKEVTRAAQDGDAALKKIDGTVGDNFRNVGNYAGAVNKLRNGLAQLGLAFGIGTIVRDAGKSIVEFDQKIADLVSITGASGNDLEFFKTQSIELGKSVTGGASAVIEAYKLIGSAKPELLQNAAALDAVTQSAITLSQASGMDLPAAATALTDAMNQFGAPAEDAARFIDALANGALFGAAEIPQVTEALLKFGAVSKTANVSLEESTALIEALAEKGLKGAEAGTALRNVMLKLSAPDALPREAKRRLDALGISFADIQDTSKPFAERLEALKPLLNDNAALVKVFGTENAVAATNLIRNSQRVQELTADMYTQGTAAAQAAERNKTLSFVLNQLKESWNALILGFTNGSGAVSGLTEALGFVARNLGSIVSFIGKAALAWGAYKTALAGIKIYERTREFIAFGKAIATGKVSTDGASESIKKMGSAFKAIGWTALIMAITEIAMALYDVATGADKANARVKALETTRKTIAAQNNLITQQIKNEIDAEKKRLEMMVVRKELTQQQAEQEYKNFLLKKEFVGTESDFETRTQKDIYRNKFDLLRKERADIENNIKLKEYEIKFLTKQGAFQNRLKISGLQGEIQALKEGRTSLNSYLVSLQGELYQTNLNILSNEDYTSSTEDKKKAVKALNTEMDIYNEYLTIQNDLLAKLAEIQEEQKIKELSDDIQKITDEMQMLADEGIISNFDEVEARINERYQLELKLIADKLAAEKAAITEKYRLESEKAKQAVTDNYLKLISQQGLTPAEKSKIEAQYKEQMDLLAQDQLQRNADLDLELKILDEKANNEEIELEKNKNEEIINLKNDLNDRIVNKENEIADNKKEADKKELDKEKEMRDARIAIIDAIAQAAIEASQRKVEAIDKEIAAAEKQSDYLKELAAQGNIDAKESLAEQNRLIVEANKRKEAELRKQERIAFANTVYQTYQKNASDEAVKNPLAKTITDVTLLSQFIKNFPTFLDGTEDTGTNGMGIDGKGGFHAILHPNERVLTKEQNSMIGNLSNESLAKIAMEYNNGSIVGKSEAAAQIGGAWHSAAIVKKIDELTQAISNKPETNIELGEIIDGAMTIIKSKKKGNSTIYNRYKIK